ncbi:MAG: transcriptional activator NhaR [Gammaproteobacteria bacterium]
MHRLNYKHLHHFWVVAKEGGVGRASESLCLTPQTISAQVTALEAAVGEALFTRANHKLLLTDRGRIVFEYADKIFKLGAELVAALDEYQPNGPIHLRVGVTDAVPKPIAYWMLEPIRRIGAPIRIVCHEGDLNRLLTELTDRRLDLVLADHPVRSDKNVCLYDHLIGEGGITFYCGRAEAATYRGGFPRSLHGAPMLLPTRHSALRLALEQWFERHDIVPTISGEFEDTALMEVFGEAGAGIFVVPTLVGTHVQRQYDVEIIGQTQEVTQKFYVISASSTTKHPAVAAINEAVGKAIRNTKQDQSMPKKPTDQKRT